MYSLNTQVIFINTNAYDYRNRKWYNVHEIFENIDEFIKSPYYDTHIVFADPDRYFFINGRESKCYPHGAMLYDLNRIPINGKFIHERAKFIGCGNKTPIYSFYRRVKYDPKNFRNGPVPGTGHSWSFGRYYRRPKTTAERRETDFMARYDDDIKEYGVKFRNRKSDLPVIWDDIPHARRGNNWKYYRKNQWKD